MATTLQEAINLALAPKPQPDPVVMALRDKCRAIYLKRIQDFFGPELPLTELTAERIEQWQEALIAESRSHYAIDRHLGELQSLLTKAFESGLLARKLKVTESKTLKAYREAQTKESRDRVARRRAAIRAAHPSLGLQP